MGPRDQSGQLQKILPPTGFDPRTVQPVAIPTELRSPLLNALTVVHSVMFMQFGSYLHFVLCLLCLYSGCFAEGVRVDYPTNHMTPFYLLQT